MASVTKRDGSARPWQVRYRDQAGRSRSEQYTRKADADARKTEIERAAQTGRLDLVEGGTQTLAQVGADFFRLHKGDWETSTARGHMYIWNSLVHGSELAAMPVRSIRRSHVQAFKVDAQDAGAAVTSIRRSLSLISRALDYAADEGMIGANPAAGIKPPSEPHRPDVYVVTPEQVEAIRAEMTVPDAALVSILAYAGLRPQEARALEPRHIGPNLLRVEAAVRPDGTLKRLKGTGGEKRSVPICKALAADLPAADLPLKSLRSKTAWDNWRKRKFLPAAQKAGVPIRKPYDLRHSIASLWLREGIDAVTVAKRLGHSVLVLHRHYSHVIEDLDPADRRSVDEMIAAARTKGAGTRSRRSGRRASPGRGRGS